MAEKYIGLDDAIDALCYFDEKSPTGRTAQEIVKAIPAADVRPVVRGRWEYNPGDNIPYCSECMMPQDGECNFCPSCGADMRKE